MKKRAFIPISSLLLVAGMLTSNGCEEAQAPKVAPQAQSASTPVQKEQSLSADEMINRYNTKGIPPLAYFPDKKHKWTDDDIKSATLVLPEKYHGQVCAAHSSNHRKGLIFQLPDELRKLNDPNICIKLLDGMREGVGHTNFVTKYHKDF